MKRKLPKTRVDPHGWKRYSITLPPQFVRGLSGVRDENGNALPLPIARGNAILNRMARALEVAEELGFTVHKRNAQIDQLVEVIEKYRKLMDEKGVRYEHIKAGEDRDLSVVGNTEDDRLDDQQEKPIGNGDEEGRGDLEDSVEP